MMSDRTNVPALTHRPGGCRIATRPDELDKATMAGCRDEAAWTFLEWRGKRIYLEYLSTSHFFRRASVDAQLGPLPPTVGPVRPSVALLPVRALRPFGVSSRLGLPSFRLHRPSGRGCSSSSVSVSSLLCFVFLLT